MIISILSYLGAVLFLLVLYLVIKLYLALRGTSNAFLAASSDDFFAKCNSLLSGQDEVPESVVEFMGFMNSTARSRFGHWHFYRAARRASKIKQNESAGNNSASDLKSAVNGMRTELRELFHGAVGAWLNYMTNRNVLCNLLIFIEFKKLQARTNSVKVEEQNFRENFVTHLNRGEFC